MQQKKGISQTGRRDFLNGSLGVLLAGGVVTGQVGSTGPADLTSLRRAMPAPPRNAEVVDQTKSDIIRHSDIDMVSWYPPGEHTVNPDDFRKWGATLVTWGLDPIFTRTAKCPQSLGELVKAAHDGGVRRYLANLDMCSAQPWNLARDAELREAIARDFNGNGLVVPWFPAVVDGVPAYFGCLNNPVYQENLRQRVREAYAAGCKGLHVDWTDVMGWILRNRGGCYCSFCMAGFKKYLLKEHSRRQLSEMGIDDIEAWDFAAEVRRVAGTKQQLPGMIKSGCMEEQIPLFRDYQAFVAQSDLNWLEELRKLNKQLGGPDAGYSINGGRVDRWLATSSLADFFTTEIRHNPEQKRVPSRVVGMYRIAESLGKMLSVTAGTVKDWSYPAKGGMDTLVAMWVSFAYANGHLFIVPNNIWAYSKEKGEHAYRGPEKVFVPLYKFVRRNEQLLDGYDPIEQFGVVYSPPDNPVKIQDVSDGVPKRQLVDRFSEICGELVEAHLPFGVVFPAASGGTRGLSEQTLGRFERIIIPEGVVLNGREKAILETWKSEGRAVTWTGPESALQGVKPMVSIAEGKRVWVFPRQRKNDPEAPVVFHLFNPSYEAEHDAMIEQTDFVLSLRSDLPNHRVRRAVLYTPDDEPREVPVGAAGGRIEITIPKLTIWGILSLE